MANFDPDAYLASKSKSPSSFDPDAYLASKVPVSMKKFGDPGVGDPDVPGYTPTAEEQAQSDLVNSYDNQMAKWSTEHPHQEVLRDISNFALEGTLPMIGGTLGGAAGSLPGGIAGSGWGYGTAKQIEKARDALIGVPQRPQSMSNQIAEPVYNTLLGATMEAGGRVVIPPVVNALARAGNWFTGLFPARQEAARIVNSAIEETNPLARAGLADVRQNLLAAPEGETISNALVKSKQPTLQAVVDAAERKSPKFFDEIADASKAEDLATLSRLAGGETRTEAIQSMKGAKEALREATQPEKNRILMSARVNQNVSLDAEQQALAAREQASSLNDDFRRMISARDKAQALANGTWDEATMGPKPSGFTPYKPSGLPRVPERYTVWGERSRLGDQIADDLAQGTLDAGRIARYNEGVLADQKELGIKPIDPKNLIKQVNSVVKPEIAGNSKIDMMARTLTKHINRWTTNRGLVDPVALDSIMKNVVLDVTEQLAKVKDPRSAARAAEATAVEFKPIIDNAIEQAGGVGYKEYKKTFASGMEAINRQDLSTELMKIYKDSPTKFAKIIKGENPELIEDFMGANKIDLKQVMPEKDYADLSKIAAKIERDQLKSELITKGEGNVKDLFNKNKIRVRLPHLMSKETTLTNDALDTLENSVSRKTMSILRESVKDPKAFNDLLNHPKNFKEWFSKVPSMDRNQVLKLLTNQTEFAKMIPSGSYAAGLNSLAPTQQENRNALAK